MGATVTTTIRVVGEDRASEEIRKARKALKETAESAEAASKNVNNIGEKSGDLERGFMGLKDVVGGLAEGPLGEMANKFGGIEAIVKGFGPALGGVGMAVAAIATGAALWYEHTEKIRKAAIDIKIKAIEASKEDLEAQALRLGVAKELIGWKERETTVAAVVAAGAKHATEIDALRLKQLEAQKENQTEKVSELGREIAALEFALRIDGRRLETARELTGATEIRTAAHMRDATRELVQQDKINGIMDKRDRLAAQSADIAGKRYTSESRRLTLLAEIKKGGGDLVAQERELNSLTVARIGLDSRDRTVAAEGQAIMESRQAAAKAANAAAIARRKALRDANFAFAAEETADIEAKFQTEREFANKAFLAAQAHMAAEKSDRDALRVTAQALTTDPAEKARLQLIEIEIAQVDRLEAAQARHYTNEAARATAMLAIENDSNAKRLAILNSEMARQKQADNAQIDGALKTAGAVVAGLEQIGLAQQAAAGLKALLAGAEAFYQFSLGNIPGGIAATAAAIQFAQIAGGAGGSSAASGGGGSFAGQTAQLGAAPQSSGGPTIINFTKGFVVGTPQQVGVAVGKAVKSVASTGYAQKKAA